MQGVIGMVLKTKPVWHPILGFYRFLTNFGQLLISSGQFYQTGSVPNPKPTRLLRVYHFWTCRRPVKGVGSDGWTSSETNLFSVRVEICKTTLDFAEIHRIYTKSGYIGWDLARFQWDLARSRRDQAGLDEISLDFDKIWPNLNEFSKDLTDIRPFLN